MGVETITTEGATATGEGDNKIVDPGKANESGTITTGDEGSKKTDEGKVEEKKADEGKKDEPVYKLKLPENSKLAADSVEKITAFAKEHKISPEAAQKLLDRDNEQLNSQLELLANKSKEWRAEVEADKIIGGENLETTKQHAFKALKQFDPDGALKAELEATGYGNHPAFVRFVAAIGKAMSEDKIHTGAEAQTGNKLAKIYTTMSQ